MTTSQTQEFLKNIEAAANASELADAVKALADAHIPETAPDLIRALNYNNPGAAVAAVDGLIAIGEPAVQPLLELLDDYNYGARAWALRALSGIGDPRSLTLLLDTAKNDFALSVRRAAAKGLGSIRWEQMAVEQRSIAQQQCTEVLLGICHDPEWVVRYSAISGLESLGLVAPELVAMIQSGLEPVSANDPEVAVQARSGLALERISYQQPQPLPTGVVV
jgi:phycocyanobilin lyase subunit beta